MNKKFLGVKLSSYLIFLICLIASFAMWLIFNIPDEIDSATALADIFLNHF